MSICCLLALNKRQRQQSEMAEVKEDVVLSFADDSALLFGNKWNEVQ